MSAINAEDERRFVIRVAGPTALLVAKLIKIGERLESPARLAAKDGLDVLRILQATEAETMATTLHRLETDPLTAQVTRTALNFLRAEGTHTRGALAALSAQAVGVLADPETTAASLSFLAQDLCDSYETLG
ncbi:hypothetical protein [Glycomyces xiaoerkulensis]|uniref:hypothetical protein n=1 Tax=Glycomyces xiaoerkulensis TaxID=2038139 RepID=UPI000C25F566|nr:hypothetical protein [Glycomyces xiaoerkulensis]